MFILLQLIALTLLLLSASLIFSIKSKWSRIFISIFIPLVVAMEAGSVYLAGNLIDYKVYTHATLESLRDSYVLFIPQSIIFILLIVVLSVTVYYLLKKLADLPRRKVITLPVLLISCGLLCLPNGVFREAYQVYQIVNAKESSFHDALEAVGIPSSAYIKPDDVVAKKGKNIIIISIESLEKGFLTKEFEGLTPTLTKLSKEWTFYDVQSTKGCGWTSGSLYCYMTGLPALYNGSGNRFFQKTQRTKLLGLSHILNKANYNMKYVAGHIEYSGKADLLRTYGIPVVSEKNSIEKYPKAHWGLYDKDLFNEAKLQVNHLSKNKEKPFAMFIGFMISAHGSIYQQKRF